VTMAEASTLRRRFLYHVFFSPARLRSGWRALLYIVLVLAFGLAIKFAGNRAGYHPGEAWSAPSFIAAETITLLVALAATLVLARLDRLTLEHYAITWREAFRARFWEGSLWGFAAVGLLIGMIITSASRWKTSRTR